MPAGGRHALRWACGVATALPASFRLGMATPHTPPPPPPLLHTAPWRLKSVWGWGWGGARLFGIRDLGAQGSHWGCHGVRYVETNTGLQLLIPFPIPPASRPLQPRPDHPARPREPARALGWQRCPAARRRGGCGGSPGYARACAEQGRPRLPPHRVLPHQGARGRRQAEAWWPALQPLSSCFPLNQLPAKMMGLPRWGRQRAILSS
jgi:hypothetical protein